MDDEEERESEEVDPDAGDAKSVNDAERQMMSGKPPKGALQKLPEILPPEQPGLNANLIIINMIQRVDPEDITRTVEHTLQSIGNYNHNQFEEEKERAEFTLDLKKRDPDEIEKRKNNATRRALKWFIALCSGLSIVGSVGAAFAGSTVASTMLGALGVVCISSLAPLAAGESMSASDIIRIIKAVLNPGAGLLASLTEKKNPRALEKEEEKS